MGYCLKSASEYVFPSVPGSEKSGAEEPISSVFTSGCCALRGLNDNKAIHMIDINRPAFMFEGLCLRA